MKCVWLVIVARGQRQKGLMRGVMPLAVECLKEVMVVKMREDDRWSWLI